MGVGVGGILLPIFGGADEEPAGASKDDGNVATKLEAGMAGGNAALVGVCVGNVCGTAAKVEVPPGATAFKEWSFAGASTAQADCVVTAADIESGVLPCCLVSFLARRAEEPPGMRTENPSFSSW